MRDWERIVYVVLVTFCLALTFWAVEIRYARTAIITDKEAYDCVMAGHELQLTLTGTGDETVNKMYCAERR